VVTGARGWQARRLREDRGKRVEEDRQKVVPCAGADGEAWGGRLSLPAHLVVAFPEGHGEGAEVPQDGPEGREPLRTQDHIVAGERKSVEVRCECLAVDGEWRGTVYARAGNAVPISHSDLHLAPGLESELRARGRLRGDEVMGRAGVQEGQERNVAEPDA